MRKFPMSRRREGQIDFALTFFMAAIVFWISVQVGTFQMDASVYGAAVVAIPAELWSGLILFANATWLFGLYINGRWRWSPFVRLLGIVSNLLFFSIFTLASKPGATGDTVTIFSAVFALMTIRYTVLTLRECVSAVGGFLWMRH